MRRIADRISGRQAHFVEAGEVFVTKEDTVAITILGSCVAMCLRDPRAGVAGMNHFLLPSAVASNGDRGSTRYGVRATEALLCRMLARGASIAGLEAKVFGGGAVLPGTSVSQLHRANVSFALQELEKLGIPVVGRETGGKRGRRLSFFTRSGTVEVRAIQTPAQVLTTANNEWNWGKS